MALKFIGKFNSSVRGVVSVDRSKLWKGKPEKSLLAPLRAGKGRNNYGRITAWRKGGGVKNKCRVIDFLRSKFGVSAVVERIEYDPNRSAFIALIKYSDDNSLSYIIAPDKLIVGDKVVSGESVEFNVGNACYLKNMPVGMIVHNVELKPGKGAQVARSAGTYAQIMGKDTHYVLLRLRSGEVRKVQSNCMATIGVVSNSDYHNISLGKAGRSRLLGKRPQVRGVAMNPVDHPHGGGEGKTSGGRSPVTPWGKPTKGYITVRKKRDYIVSSRRSKKI